MTDNAFEERLRDIIGRREFLRSAATLSLPLMYTASGMYGAAAQVATSVATSNHRPSGMAGRQVGPEIVGFPISRLSSFITPTEQFYIRSHFEAPQLDRQSWRMRVEGAVKRHLELTYEDLMAMKSRSLTAVLECAGNSSSQLFPLLQGLGNESKLVSNAEWTGVPLASVLNLAGVTSRAVEVVLEGADDGDIQESKSPKGLTHYARSIPMSKARQPEVLLAYRMNGAELPLAHGYPVRAVVPGLYGMASVKWLKRIIVSDRRFDGYFQTMDYAFWEHHNGLPVRTPVAEMQVKSLIARPRMHEVITRDTDYRIFGAAWTGESDVKSVEVSSDKGQSWHPAKLIDEPVRYAWRLWEWNWHSPAHACYTTLMARATDARGFQQPLSYDDDRCGYMVNKVFPVEVEVR